MAGNRTKHRRHDEVGTGQCYRAAWAGAASNYSIVDNDPAGQNRMCRRIQLGAAGTLVVTGPDGTNVTLPSGPLVWDIQASALVAAGSTAVDVVVIW